ncbi:glycine betaine ABC transporter substrate-binding protein [Texcoconibacillus texcoconensis]|uniref:Glycine betaine/proline transport system substrate-binding protein n=1 Tax=Texcoconibacillus texcoconensis TaxID=1095777 RepID=A0A840QSF1_9BACI|nr:glycine betaine ABC transporter substrate-binding protein [Texcoconibacillus texcoconensis]MBB5174243.1 glycine betaine/proline transport system substrate-binding protein [Texcoconibacillus texcoconensis]
MKLKKFGVVTGLSLALIAAGCGAEEEDTTEIDENGDEDQVEENGDGEEEAGSDFGEEVDYTITGIDAGAGVTASTEEVLEAYDLEDWSLQTSSGAAMTQALGDAFDNEEPIIVTGWNPHWKFAEYDLKYLEDTQGTFGEGEDIQTFARQGLEEDHPEAFEVLDNFYWEGENMNEVMLNINEGADEEEAARDWVDANEDMVSEWTNGLDAVDGEEIELVYVAWDSEIASTNVVAQVLEDLGYDVTITPLEAPYMFQSVAAGDADGMVAAWLPITHEHLLEDFEDDIVSLGVNLEGAQTGLVVPEYVDIDSIEDLK